MQVLITGGAGYIGSLLTDLLLKQGCNVTVLDNLMYGSNAFYRIEHPGETFITTLSGVGPEYFTPSRFQFIDDDVRNYKTLDRLLSQQNFDAIVHLAAIVGVRSCRENEKAAWEINTAAPIKLAELAQRYGVGHFLFASTYSVYGDQNGRVVDEESAIQPIHVYESSKVEVEKYLRSTVNFPYTIFRFATAAGLSFRTRFDLLSNQLAVEAGKKRHCCIYEGKSMRSFVHVRDIAQAIKAAMYAPKECVTGECFNVGEAYDITEEQYGALTCSKAELMEQIVQSYDLRKVSVSCEASDFSEDARDAILIAKKFRDRIGFVPSLSLRDSIDEIRDLVLSSEEIGIDPYHKEYYERAGQALVV